MTNECKFQVAIWTPRNLPVLVLGEIEGYHGDRRISVCKATATDVKYSFSVLPEDLSYEV